MAACIVAVSLFCACAEEVVSTAPGKVHVRPLDEAGALSEVQTMDKVVKTDAEWQRLLTPEQYRIARGKGTEPAFCGAFYDNHQDGLYKCVCCGLPLFASTSKFDSGTGWPDRKSVV